MSSPSHDPFVGRTFGTFRIKERLGAGGMGVVYVAHDERLRRTVALKMLRPALAVDSRRRTRFLREARYLASIVHPNVVSVYEVGETYGVCYMTMELVPGKNLREYLLRGRPAPAVAMTIARDIARALARAHTQGIIHRDLKPDNVIVYEANAGVVSAKVLDFGLAKALEPSREETQQSFVTAIGVAVGTAGYMSPEQARGWPVDARSDVYALGVLMHEMLTGQRPPLVDEGRAFAPPSSLARGIPPAIDALVAKCLSRDPERRFANALAVLGRLERACERLPETAAPVRRAATAPTIPDVPSLVIDLRPPPAPPPRPAPRIPAPRPSGVPLLLSAAVTMFAGCFSIGRLTAPNAPPIVAQAAAAAPTPMPPAPPPPAPAASSATDHAPPPPSAHRPPMPARSAPPPSAVPPASASAPPVDCANPFLVDDAGIRVVRRECLRR